MTIGENIKKIRKAKRLTQQKLAKAIGISQNGIALIESGKRNPSDQTILSICREFHVNETWLRTGEGEMFAKPSDQAEQVREWVDGIFEKGSDFEKRFIASMSRFTLEDWDMMERLIRKVWEDQQAFAAAQKAAPPSAYTEEELAAYEKVKAAKEAEDSIDREVSAYRAELEAEEKAKARSSASPGAGDAGKESA